MDKNNTNKEYTELQNKSQLLSKIAKRNKDNNHNITFYYIIILLLLLFESRSIPSS